MIHFSDEKERRRKLDHKTLEELRMRVVKRVQDGESPEVLAKASTWIVHVYGCWRAIARPAGMG